MEFIKAIKEGEVEVIIVPNDFSSSLNIET